MTAVIVQSPDLARAVAGLSAANVKGALARPVPVALRKSANVYRKYVRAEASRHRRTGKMRDKVRTQFKGSGLSMVAKVRATGAVSNLIAGGVQPHPISAEGVMPMWSTGTAAWKRGAGSGVTGFARGTVQHPGFAADPFFERGMERAQSEVDAILRDLASEAAATVARLIRG